MGETKNRIDINVSKSFLVNTNNDPELPNSEETIGQIQYVLIPDS